MEEKEKSWSGTTFDEAETWKWSQQYSFPESLNYTEAKAAWRKEEENHLDLPNLKKEITSLQTQRKTGQDSWPEAQTPVRSSPFLWFGGIQHMFVTCFGPRTVPGSGVMAVDKSDKSPCPCGGVHFLVGKIDNKQINKESLLPVGCCCIEKVEPSLLLTMNL